MMNLLILTLFAVAAFLFAEVKPSESLEIKSIRFEPHVYFVGDSVDLRITFYAGKTETIENPSDLPQSEWLEIKSATVEKRENEVEIVITFISFAPGNRTLPSILFGSLLVKDIKIPVKSITLNEEQPIRSIKRQILLPGTRLFIAVGLALLSILPFMFYFIWRMIRFAWRSVQSYFQLRMPEFRLWLLVRKLRPLVETLEAADWYTRLTNGLRLYLGNKIGHACMSATTAEIARMFELRLYDLSYLVEIFEQADLVRFAGYNVEKVTLRETLKRLATVLASQRQNRQNQQKMVREQGNL